MVSKLKQLQRNGWINEYVQNLYMQLLEGESYNMCTLSFWIVSKISFIYFVRFSTTNERPHVFICELTDVNKFYKVANIWENFRFKMYGSNNIQNKYALVTVTNKLWTLLCNAKMCVVHLENTCSAFVNFHIFSLFISVKFTWFWFTSRFSFDATNVCG